MPQKMQRSFARNFLLTDQTRNMLRNFGRYSRAKLFLRSYMWSVILLGFELSVKKVASGKFFSAGVKASIDPQRNASKAEQIPPSAPSTCVRRIIFSLKIRLRLFYF